MISKEPNLVRIYPVCMAVLFLVFAAGQPQALAQTDAIKWYSMQEAQKLAQKTGKKVLAYAEASWCVYCQKMEKEVFPRQAVIDSMNTYYYPVRVDIESEKEMIYNGNKITKRDFARAHQVRATPTTFFIDQEGKILGGQPGFIPAETFCKLLAFVGSDAFKRMDFKMYVKQTSAPEN